MDTQVLIPLYKIDPNPFQQEGVRDEAKVAEIAESLQRNRENGAKGLLQLPIARRVGDRCQLAFGHHRFYAFDCLFDQGDTFFEEMPLLVRELSDQEMFEALAAENFKRRDIGDIEKARTIQDYMTRFEKNSVETGAFFNLSPESVRDLVRLLKLPKDLQSGVEDGTINRSNARRLLTIQRVAPDQVREVAKELKGNTEADPDQVISRTLVGSGNTVLMWANWHRGDEAMAGEHLWPLRLSAEKFPKSHLPEMSVTQVVKLMGLKMEYGDKRVAETYLNHFKAGGPVEGIKEESYTAMNKGGCLDRLAHLINPPACSACPFYAKVNGDHFCAFKECHNRKVKAWQSNELEQAIQSLGIAAYDHKTDGKYIVLVSYNETHKKLVSNASPDLRLRKGNTYSGFDGVPDGFAIVAVGKIAEKLLTKEASSSRNDTNSDNYREEQRRLAKMREAHQDATYAFLWNVATPSFAGLLNDVTNVEFLLEMSDRMARGVPAEEPNGKSTKAVRLDFYRRALLFSLLDDVLDMWEICQQKNPVVTMAKELQGQAATWGVKLPKNWMEQAAEADKAITVTVETVKAAA